MYLVAHTFMHLFVGHPVVFQSEWLVAISALEWFFFGVRHLMPVQFLLLLEPCSSNKLKMRQNNPNNLYWSDLCHTPCTWMACSLNGSWDGSPSASSSCPGNRTCHTWGRSVSLVCLTFSWPAETLLPSCLSPLMQQPRPGDEALLSRAVEEWCLRTQCRRTSSS